VARPPAPVRALQRARLVLPPEHHALHHRESHDRAFCVTSGWLNPLLDGIGLFRALDRAVEQAGALHLRRRAGRT